MTNQSSMQIDEETLTELTINASIAIWSRTPYQFPLDKYYLSKKKTSLQPDLSGSQLHALHVVALNNSSTFVQKNMDENQQFIEALWRFSINENKDQFWENIKDEIYEQHNFSMTLKLLVIYDMLFQYAAGQVQKPITDHSTVNSLNNIMYI